MYKNGKYSIDCFSNHYVNSPSLTEIPEIVGELGPGRNIGSGIVALLLGAKEYWAFEGPDPRRWDEEDNTRYLNEIYTALLEGYRTQYLPSFSKADLHDRYTAVMFALKGTNSREAAIHVQHDWQTQSQALLQEYFSYIWSHQVMEHVMCATDVYVRIQGMLKPGGIQSHSIDFSAHGTTPEGNGHYAYDRRKWEELIGFRDPLRSNLNALPPSFHKATLACLGNEITLWKTSNYPSDTPVVTELPRDTLIPDSEKLIRDCYVEAVKTGLHESCCPRRGL